MTSDAKTVHHNSTSYFKLNRKDKCTPIKKCNIKNGLHYNIYCSCFFTDPKDTRATHLPFLPFRFSKWKTITYILLLLIYPQCGSFSEQCSQLSVKLFYNIIITWKFKMHFPTLTAFMLVCYSLPSTKGALEENVRGKIYILTSWARTTVFVMHLLL